MEFPHPVRAGSSVLRSQLLTDTPRHRADFTRFSMTGSNTAAKWRLASDGRVGCGSRRSFYRVCALEHSRGAANFFVGTDHRRVRRYDRRRKFPRRQDMEVNVTAPRRNSPTCAPPAPDEAIRLIPHREPQPWNKPSNSSLTDEYVEIYAPQSIRLRKKVLQYNKRPRPLARRFAPSQEAAS